MRLQDKLAERVHAEQPKVEAVRRDGVHAHSRIAHAGKARGDQSSGINAHQRIRVARADQLHVAQSVGEAARHLLGEGIGRHLCQLVDGVAGQCQYDRRARQTAFRIVVHGQQGQCLPVAEPFPGNVFVWYDVRHHEH